MLSTFTYVMSRVTHSGPGLPMQTTEQMNIWAVEINKFRTNVVLQ